MINKRPKSIEEKLDYLMEFLRKVHVKFNMHEWVKDYRPWNEDDEEAGIYWIKCFCGEERKVTEAEFHLAEEEYSGFY